MPYKGGMDNNDLATQFAKDVLAGKWRDDSGRFIQPAIAVELAKAVISLLADNDELVSKFDAFRSRSYEVLDKLRSKP